MVNQFIRTWKLLEKDENFDRYMEAIGIDKARRALSKLAKAMLVVTMATDEVITVKVRSSLKKVEVKFKLGEVCDETTVDGRNVKSIFTLEDGKLVQKQSWKGQTTTLEREIQDDGKLMAVKCTMNNVVATRMYEKIM